MEEKQDKLEKEFGLGHYERFTVDYETLILSFYDNEQKMVDVSIIPIASHVPEKEDLKWAWANEIYPLEIRKKSEIMKELAKMTGFEMFNNPSIECDEDMAWEINAVACKFTNSQGVYRVPHGHINVHVIITDVTKCG